MKFFHIIASLAIIVIAAAEGEKHGLQYKCTSFDLNKYVDAPMKRNATVLSADCPDVNNRRVNATLDLHQCIVNNHGVLQWRDKLSQTNL
ncbi:hypothetical protein SGCOL_009324 [Colletotrichum sp. CLE4]